MLAATPGWLPILIGGNLVALAAGLFALAVWVRRLFKRHLTDPITRLQSSVDNLTSNDLGLQTQMKDVKRLAEKAHDRIDTILSEGALN